MKCIQTLTFSDLIRSFVSKHKWFTFVYFLLLLAIPIRDIVLPNVIGKIYQKISNNEINLGKLFIALFSLISLLQICSIFSDIVEMRLKPMFKSHIMDLMFKHIFQESSKNFSDVQISDIISKLMVLPSTCHYLVRQFKLEIIPCVITILGIFIYLFFTEPFFAFTFLCLFVFCFIVAKSLLTKCNNSSEKCEQSNTLLSNSIDDILRNLSTVINANASDKELKNINTILSLTNTECGSFNSCIMMCKYLIVPVILLYFIFSLYLMYKKYIKKQISSSYFISLIIIGFLTVSNILSVSTLSRDLIDKWSVLSNSMEIFKQCTPNRIKYSLPAYIKRGICIQDLTFFRQHEGNNKVIFNNLFITIPEHKITLIKGGIGTGKTTLTNLILGNIMPFTGEVFIDGIPISKLKDENVNNHYLFFVPQNPILFNRNLFENISYGLNISKENVIQTLERLDLYGFIKQFPYELNYNVGLYGSKLSGGQKQIVWLFKCLFNDSKYVILDEPTASIDTKLKQIVFELIKHISRNKTIVVISHDTEIGELVDAEIDLEKHIKLTTL